MYELFVLGELTAGEKHGYVLQEILKNAGGPIRQISSGTLYPLLTRLVDNGLIQLRLEEETPGGRPRKIYGITDAGRERFQQLMRKPLPLDAETERLFGFKIVYFPYVTKEVRIACLEQFLHYLQHVRHYIVDFESRLIEQKPDPEEQRLQLLRVFDYRKRVGSAQIEWVKNEIERIKDTE